MQGNQLRIETSMKKFITGLLIAAGIVGVSLNAQQNTSPQNSQVTIRVSYASEEIVVAATAIGFTSALITPTCTDCPINTLRATLATCTLETANIRVLSDGTDPTTTDGLLITMGSTFSVYGYTNIAAFRAIRATGTSGDLDCQYSRIP